MINKLALILFFGVFAICASGQTTEFTYQGKLLDGSFAPTGNYDLIFRLFRNLAGGTSLGPNIRVYNQPVVNGIFTVKLDFGTQFDGDPRHRDRRAKAACKDRNERCTECKSG